MRALSSLFLAFSVFVACTGPEATDTDPIDSDASDTATDGPFESSFASGTFVMDSLVLNPQDVGADQDEDGTPDNNLPTVLTVAAGFATLDIQYNDPADTDTTQGINITLENSISSGDLNILVDASHGDLTLDLSILAGDRDTVDSLTVNPDSFENGEPISQLTGHFTSETSFTVGPTDMYLPMTFFPGEDPILIPAENATITGTMDANGITATLAGVAPSEAMMEEVIGPVLDSIPEEQLPGDKEALITSIEEFLYLDTMSDIDLGDDRRGVSVAFTFTAAPETWTE